MLPMKKLTLSLMLVAALTLGVGQALGHAAHAKAPTKVMVVMHDPGCHVFSVGGRFEKKLAVSGPARLVNFDEATLLVAGKGAVRRAAVGKSVLLGKGTYTITMVRQAPDDNHLRLVVR